MKHTCPHCGEKTISPIKKAFAGNPKAKGTVCPNCGKRSTNELKSAIFHNIINAIALVFCVYAYVNLIAMETAIYMAISIVGAFVITHLVDAFFFKLVPAIRLDFD